LVLGKKSKVLLTPLVILGLLFLPSCSNAEAEACEDTKSISEAYIEKAREFRFEYNVNTKTKTELNRSLAGYYYRQANEQNLKYQKVIFDNPQCFLPEEVALANELIEKNLKVCARAKDESIHIFDRTMDVTNCVEF
jgi:hypothetical protein